jgi:hypothetical protein
MGRAIVVVSITWRSAVQFGSPQLFARIASSFALIAFGLREDEYQIFFALLAHRSSDVNQSVVGPG